MCGVLCWPITTPRTRYPGHGREFGVRPSVEFCHRSEATLALGLGLAGVSENLAERVSDGHGFGASGLAPIPYSEGTTQAARMVFVPESTAQVLLIEDGEADRLLVRELLTVKGRGRLSLTEARDLRGGLELLGKQSFDLVLLDTKLPEVTALHALRAVAEQAPSTPILTHLAYITIRTRQAARERGTFDVVVRGDLNPMWSAVTKLLSMTERLY